MLFDPSSVEKDPRFKKLSRANKRRCELDLTNSERSSDKFINSGLTNQQVIQKETNRIRIMNWTQKERINNVIKLKLVYDALTVTYEKFWRWQKQLSLFTTKRINFGSKLMNYSFRKQK